MNLQGRLVEFWNHWAARIEGKEPQGKGRFVQFSQQTEGDYDQLCIVAVILLPDGSIETRPSGAFKFCDVSDLV